jgi:hypothetical protein
MRLRLITLFALFAQIVIGFQGAAPVAATSTLSTTFFNDDFEAATLGANWSTSTTGTGVVALNSNYPHGGTQSVFIGQNVDGIATESFVLAFDLSGQTDVFLDFWARATGSNGYRIVSISDNGGSSWKQILDLTAISQSFSHQVIDLSSVAAANGVTLNSQFHIRFSYNSGNAASDGFVIDDLRLTQHTQAIATFPLAQDSFEAAGFQQGFYPQSTLNGVAEINTNYPHSGAQSVFLGQKVAGNAYASLILAIDLSGQTDVFLDFWMRATGSYGNSRTVSISDNGGGSWKQILDLTAASQSFSHQVIDLASVVATNGLALDNQFRISISFVSNLSSPKAGDGLVIDDLRLTQRAQAIASLPFGPETFESGTVQQGIYPQSTGDGIAEINTSYSHSGAKSLFLGQNVNIVGSGSASLILALDLTGQTDVLLDFWTRLTGNYGGRSVSISNDSGTTWKQILDLSKASPNFSHQLLDIAGAATANGLTLNNQFRIMFNYTADRPEVSNGFVIDDLRLAQHAQIIASFPFGPESFESGNVQQGFYPQSTGDGIAEINTSYPHSGSKSMFLGQNTNNVVWVSSTSLIIALDLTGQTHVFLDFWTRRTGNYGGRSVSISNDSGTTWKQILDLSAAPQSFIHQSLDIASLAATNGLTLNNRFRIRFYYTSERPEIGNGFVVDDLQLSQTDPTAQVKVYLPLITR